MMDVDTYTVARNTTIGKEPAGAGCHISNEVGLSLIDTSAAEP